MIFKIESQLNINITIIWHRFEWATQGQLEKERNNTHSSIYAPLIDSDTLTYESLTPIIKLDYIKKNC